MYNEFNFKVILGIEELEIGNSPFLFKVQKFSIDHLKNHDW